MPPHDTPSVENELRHARQQIAALEAELTACRQQRTATTDTNELEQAALALRRSEYRYRRLVELSPNGIAIHDGHTILFANVSLAAMLRADSEDDLIGVSIMSIVHPASRRAAAERIRQILDDGVVAPLYEEQFVRLDGGIVDVEVVGIPFDYEGRPAVEIIARDITTRKQAEREREDLLQREQAARLEAQEAVRLRDLFLATMSHELRTPLNAIIGYQHLMLYSGTLDPDNQHMTERSIANSQRLLSLINDILDIARVASGALHIVPVELSVGQVAEVVAENLRPAADARQLALHVTVDPAIPMVIWHDVDRLTQVVTNLVNNAIKFTERGAVTLTFSRYAERLRIEVTDTGIGIPADQHDRIFDDFVQVDSSPTREHQGAGLGLSIVRRIVTAMDGQVTVASTPGEGSTFTVDVPLNLPMLS